MFQPAGRHAEHAHAWHCEGRLRSRLPLEHVQERPGVVGRPAAQPGDDLFVAGAFPLASGLAVGPPHERMEIPPQKLREQLQ